MYYYCFVCDIPTEDKETYLCIKQNKELNDFTAQELIDKITEYLINEYVAIRGEKGKDFFETMLSISCYEINEEKYNLIRKIYH